MSSDPHTRAYVESADCVLMLGTFITDMNMGIYTARLERTHTVLATTESIKVGFHQYEDVEFADYLRGLLNATSSKARGLQSPGLQRSSAKNSNTPTHTQR